MFFQRLTAFFLLALLLVPLAPSHVSAHPSLEAATTNIAIDTDGHAEFDEDGNLYVAGTRAGNTPYETAFFYNHQDQEFVDAPFFLGNIDLAIPDGEDGYFVYAAFEQAQQPVGHADQSTLTADEPTSIVHLDEDGNILSIVPLVVDEIIESMVYVAAYDALFISGFFLEVNDTAHAHLACIDPSTGDFCVIGETDWADTTGFFAAGGALSVAYDAVDDRLLVGGYVSEWAEGDPESTITVLDPADPSENLAADYLTTAPEDLPQNNERPVRDIRVYNLGADLDGNEIDERILLLFTRPVIKVYVDNGAEFFTDFSISTDNYNDAELVVQPGEPEVAHFVGIQDEGVEPTLALSEVVIGYADDTFTASAAPDEITYDILDWGEELYALDDAVLLEDGTLFVGGDFEYQVDGAYENYNVIGLDNASEIIYSGLNAQQDIDTLVASGDTLFGGGQFQTINPTITNRGIMRIDADTHDISEDLDFAFLDEDGDPVEVSYFTIEDPYLYVYGEEDIFSYRDLSSGVVTLLDRPNLLRLDLDLGAVDEDFGIADFPLEERLVDVVSVSDTLLYGATDTTIYAINPETETIDEDFQETFEAALAAINFDGLIDMTHFGDELYIAFRTSIDTIDVAHVGTDGTPSVFYSVNGADEMDGLTVVDDGTLVLGYQIDGSAFIEAFTLGEDALGELYIGLNLSRFEFTREASDDSARVRSFAEAGGALYIAGRFDTITDTESDETFSFPQLFLIDLATGEPIEREIFENATTDDYSDSTRLAFDDTNNLMALYGDYSFQLSGEEASLRDQSFGLVLFPTGEPPALEITDPIPSRTRASGARLGFTFEDPGETGAEPLVEECGAEVLINESNGEGELFFNGLEVGETYECSFVYRNQYGASEEAAIGPFTVTRRSGGGGGGSTTAPLIISDEEALQINGGTTRTEAREVEVRVRAENVREISLSETGVFGAHVPFATSLPFTLSEGSGLKTIFARVVGVSGEVEILRAQIEYVPASEVLHVTAPPAVTPIRSVPITEEACIVGPYPTTRLARSAQNPVDQVRALEAFLGRTQDGLFDEGDQTAVARFQEEYVTSVLAPLGLVRGTGIVGQNTLAQIKRVAETRCETSGVSSQDVGALACLQGTAPLVRGTQSEDVRRAQRLLKHLGFFNEEPTGFFGPVTETAVRQFQQANKISSVGIIGPTTRSTLHSLSQCR